MTNGNNEIPVKRRGGGIPWWAWLLGLAALALLAFLLLGQGNNNNAGNTNQGGGATQSPAGGGGASPAGGGGTSPEASEDAGASGSPASSWFDTRTLTVVLPASAGIAA